MAATYEPIASATLGSAASSLTISSIPATFTDLVVILFGKGNDINSRTHTFRFNSDTGSNYSATYLFGNGTVAGSTRASSQTSGWVGLMPRNTGDFAPTRVHIMSYSDVNVYKTCLSESTAPDDGVRRYVSLWRSTAAIHSITWLRNDGSNIAAGSEMYVYGIKAA